MRYYAAVVFSVIVFGLPWAAATHPDRVASVMSEIERAGGQLAAVILAHNPKSVADLKADYAASSAPSVPARKVRILIVPGHEPDYGGAEYRSLKERDMTVELGQDLQGFLDQDQHYQVFITRDAMAWTPEFSTYFKDRWDDIFAWEQASKQEMSRITALGSASQTVSSVKHNTAPNDVAMRLYGITKWADENGIDIMIHIHFNDDPVHASGVPGTHSGFAIYVPAVQYGNSSTTKAVADTVFKRLAKYNPVSNLPGESAGIIDEPELIAIGANNTSDAASMLIEYAYIYEPEMQNDDARHLEIKDLAYQTYLGLQDFFDPNNAISLDRSYDTLMLPHSWESPISDASASTSEVFALQSALLHDGDYPPAGKTLNDCPRTGFMGGCTKASLAAFQRKYGITGEDGVAGQKTLDQLNRLYSSHTAI